MLGRCLSSSFPPLDLNGACILPTPHPSHFLGLRRDLPFPISHVLSVSLQAPLSPVQPSTRPALLFVTPPYLTLPVCLPLLPQSSASTSILHGPFSPLSWVSILNLTYLGVTSDEFMLYFSTSCSVWLPSNLISSLCLSLSRSICLSVCLCPSLSLSDVRKATMDCAVTSLSPRQMPSYQIQV